MFGEFDPIFLLMAFCGGIFGAAIGALPSFVLCGFGALIGGAVSMASKGTVQSDMLITWGALVGPQAAFAGGTAAAAFAKKIGVHDNGRDICTSLMGLNKPSVLVVGGIFGLLGALITWGLTFIPSFVANGVSIAPVNHIALAIIICMILTRICFGRTGVFGKLPEGKRRWVSNDQGSWVPWQSDWAQILLISIAIGLPTAYLAKELPSSGLLIFGFGCVAFIYLQYGTKIPIFHHIALAAILGTGATGNIYWGLAMAVTCGFACEVFAVLFVYHGDTHIDPPTFALTFMGTFQPILLWLGVMPMKNEAVNITVFVPITFISTTVILFFIFFTIVRKNTTENLNIQLIEEIA